MAAHTHPRTDLLLIGEAASPTGYARVLRSIFEPMAERWTIHQLAPRYDGGEHDYPWTLHAAHTEGDLYGCGRLPALMDRLRPRLVFVLSDFCYQARYLEVLRRLPGDFRMVAYSPVEAGPVVPETMEAMAGLDHHVLYTRYGLREVAAAYDAVGHHRPDFRPPALSVIPHGVDTDTFYPCLDDEASRRRHARSLLFAEMPELHDAFIVLNANRNQPRKQIDVTMKGFALFARDKPENVKLYLHMGVADRGWNVAVLARRLGIDGRLVLTTGEAGHPDLPSERLNLLYNACDVGINTSSGEGWGLVSFEHGATRAAQIVPRHTSQVELWQGAAEWLEPVMTVTNPVNLTDAHLLSPEDVARALERLYADPAHRRQLAERAYANAHRPEYRWAAISRQWEGLLAEVLAARRAA